MAKHVDWTHTPTPVEGVPTEIGHEPSLPITPQTPVVMSLRTQIAMVVGLATALAGTLATYYALAATDHDLAARVEAIREKVADNRQKADQAVRRLDLENLRMKIREDFTRARWHCQSVGRGSMVCVPTLHSAQDEEDRR
jgi:hypothetical protein